MRKISEITEKIIQKTSFFLCWRRINKDIKKLGILINSQNEKGCDLYDDINEYDRQQLIECKNDLLTCLVKKNNLDGYRATKKGAQKKWESYLERLVIEPEVFYGKSVLEVGSGHSAALFNCGGAEIVNIDPLMDIYSKYIIDFPDIFFKIRFINSSAESIPFEDNKFDIIVCVNSLDHFNNSIKAIKETERLLKPGGLFFLNVDCKDRARDRHLKRVGHPYSFTSAKLKILFDQTKLLLQFEKEFPELSSITMHFIKDDQVRS